MWKPRKMKAQEKGPHHISGCKVNQLFARYKTKTKTITIFNENYSHEKDNKHYESTGNNEGG